MNLKNLAKTLGISETTVSRALNGYPEVSERTRERVMAAAQAAAHACEVMLVVGTSGQVWPAAGLAGSARRAGARVIVVNPDATALDDEADALLRGPSATVLPRLLDF